MEKIDNADVVVRQLDATCHVITAAVIITLSVVYFSVFFTLTLGNPSDGIRFVESSQSFVQSLGS